jgi:hypothetical protein
LFSAIIGYTMTLLSMKGFYSYLNTATLRTMSLNLTLNNKQPWRSHYGKITEFITMLFIHWWIGNHTWTKKTLVTKLTCWIIQIWPWSLIYHNRQGQLIEICLNSPLLFIYRFDLYLDKRTHMTKSACWTILIWPWPFVITLSFIHGFGLYLDERTHTTKLKC